MMQFFLSGFVRWILINASEKHEGVQLDGCEEQKVGQTCMFRDSFPLMGMNTNIKSEYLYQQVSLFVYLQPNPCQFLWSIWSEPVNSAKAGTPQTVPCRLRAFSPGLPGPLCPTEVSALRQERAGPTWVSKTPGKTGGRGSRCISLKQIDRVTQVISFCYQTPPWPSAKRGCGYTQSQYISSCRQLSR